MYLHSESKLLPHLSVLPAPLVYKWEQTLATTAGKSKGEKISITVRLGSFLGVEARREEQHSCWQPVFLSSIGSEGLKKKEKKDGLTGNFYLLQFLKLQFEDIILQQLNKIIQHSNIWPGTCF